MFYKINNITKKNRRVKKYKNNKRILKESCNNIYSIKKLTKRINKSFPILKKNKEKITYTIHPYCNEKTKIGFNLDYVSRPMIQKKLLNKLKEEYNYNYKFDNKIIKSDFNNRYYESPKTNSKLFYNYISNKKHDKLIVTHSYFMTDFVEYIYNNLSKDNEKNKIQVIFDNLDILQLIILPNSNSNSPKNTIMGLIIRRYKNNYKENIIYINSDKFNKNMNLIDIYKSDNRMVNIFLIRHCIGCHNLISNKSIKTLKAFNPLGNEKGHLEWAICIKETYTELKKKVKPLHKLFKDFSKSKYSKDNYYGYQFGSSIIFRAILTMLLVFNTIFIDNKNIKTKNKTRKLINKTRKNNK